MPYLKSNWASMPPLEEFGRFAFGEIFTIPEMTLTQMDPTARACYLHGACCIGVMGGMHRSVDVAGMFRSVGVIAPPELPTDPPTYVLLPVALEHQARVQEMDIVCAAPTIVVNLMRGESTTNMSYTYLTTLKGQPSEEYPGCFSYRIDASLLSHVEVWQLQIKFLFPRVGEKSLLVKRVSVIVEDQAKRTQRGEVTNKAESAVGRKGVLDRAQSTAIQQWAPPPPSAYAPPPPPQPFNAESAVMVGLVVVDQVLGVMTKEIQVRCVACRGGGWLWVGFGDICGGCVSTQIRILWTSDSTHATRIAYPHTHKPQP